MRRNGGWFCKRCLWEGDSIRILWGEGRCRILLASLAIIALFFVGRSGVLSRSGGITSALEVESECFEGIWWLLARVSLQLSAVWLGVCPVVSLEGSLSLCIPISSQCSVHVCKYVYI